MIQGRDYNNYHLRRRLMVVAAIIVVIFFIILARLFNLQIVENLQWQRRARVTSSRSEPLSAERGLIWDRNQDIPLALNIDAFVLDIIPAAISPLTPEDLSLELEKIIDMRWDEIMSKIPVNWQNSWKSIEISDDISYETIVRIAENKEKFPGVHWQSRAYRWYNETGSISHLLGYTGEITSEELQVLYNQGYNNASKLGKMGIEKAFDGMLRGKDGLVSYTVDASGRHLSDEANIRPPERGFDLVLTLDRHIQQLAEKALGPRKGAIVVLRPSNGEILAMVSYPSFDPNVFMDVGPGNFANLSLNRDFPFLNRATQAAYVPASLFKIIVSAAALGEDVISPSTTINCRGFMMLGNRKFWCHKRSGHGYVNLKSALEQSCNIYFGTVGVEKLGIDIISRYARAFGLGSVTGIELYGDLPGFVPTRAWKEETYNTPWTGGDTLNTSIGQGFLLVTPLQMANMLSAIVNLGVIYRPQILKKVVQRSDDSLETLEAMQPEILHKIDFIDEEVYDIIQESLRGVVTQGTGKWAIYSDSVKIAGKTGTGEIGFDNRWHDWFLAYGPYKTSNPDERIVVVAIVEASENYDWWAPKATDIIFEGVFGNRTHDEVIKRWQKRRIWWSWSIRELPQPGWPYREPEGTSDAP